MNQKNQRKSEQIVQIFQLNDNHISENAIQ